MKAYLMSQGLWPYVDGSETQPQVPNDPKYDNAGTKITATQAKKDSYSAAITLWVADKKVFDKGNLQALGNIVLRSNPSIQERLTNVQFAEDAWGKLLDMYGQATPTTVYQDFKETLNIRIKTDQNPGSQLDRMQAAFSRLSSANVRLPQPIQAMIALAALPQKWEVLVPVVTGTITLDKLEFNDVREAVMSQFQTEQARNPGSKDKKQHNAKKMSAVKRKHGDPSFSNQQEDNQNKDKKPYKQRGSRGKGKEIGRAHV